MSVTNKITKIYISHDSSIQLLGSIISYYKYSAASSKCNNNMLFRVALSIPCIARVVVVPRIRLFYHYKLIIIFHNIHIHIIIIYFI